MFKAIKDHARRMLPDLYWQEQYWLFRGLPKGDYRALGQRSVQERLRLT